MDLRGSLSQVLFSLVSCATNSIPVTSPSSSVLSAQCDCRALPGSPAPGLPPGNCHELVLDNCRMHFVSSSLGTQSPAVCCQCLKFTLCIHNTRMSVSNIVLVYIQVKCRFTFLVACGGMQIWSLPLYPGHSGSLIFLHIQVKICGPLS